MEFVKKNYNTTSVKENNEVVWIEHNIFSQFSELRTAYSTRIGGVSSGVCSSMNLRNCEWDTPENYRKNMQLFCDAAGFSFDNIVATHQTHTTNVEVITEKEVPRGTLFDKQFTDVDGLVTNVPGVTLVTSYADCIPLYFYDPVNRAIGSSHSGWRGTAGRIGLETINKMKDNYNTDPKDLYVAIGPGICQSCYEVSEDLIEEFNEIFDEKQIKEIFAPGREGHFYLDLWKANYYILLSAGVPENHISVTDICTRCNPEFLFSHRVMGNKRGNQCGFIMLKKDR